MPPTRRARPRTGMRLHDPISGLERSRRQVEVGLQDDEGDQVRRPQWLHGHLAAGEFRSRTQTAMSLLEARCAFL